MRFMMIVKANKDYEAGQQPSPALMEAVGKLSQEQMKAGKLLMAEGLLPSSAGARIYVSGGELSVKDGPFSETKELVGGFAIIEAASLAEAIEDGRRFMQLHAKLLGPSYVGQLEIRPIAGPDDPCR